MEANAEPLAEGARIPHNLVRPHQALEGQAPAEVAVVDIEGKNRWMEQPKKAASE